MSSNEQVRLQMLEYDMPQLPAGHPLLDGAFHRFGPKKKAWYVLRELTLPSGRKVVTGAFGVNQGENHNTVPVKIDAEALNAEDRAEYVRQQRKAEAAEEQKRAEAARLAAGRARDQWTKAEHVPVVHAYLVRKQIPGEGLRVGLDGRLLIPLLRNGQIMGLQKIDQDGNKLLNKGMDAVGVAHVLGTLAGAPIIAIGEGYATCASVRLSLAPGYDLPVVVALNAGNLIHVAKALRQRYPHAHLLMLADDDYLLTERFVASLQDVFKVSGPVPIDGVTHRVTNDDGDLFEVTAWWRKDAQGVEYIATDIRKGRVVRTPTFTNAGVASCHAAAAAAGNASVAVPLFSIDRAGRKITDWNDLHIEEGLDAVAAQMGAFLLAAQQRNTDSSASRALSQEISPIDEAEIPAHIDEVPAPATPAVDPAVEEVASMRVPTLEVLLSHFCLVYPTTDVWDSLRKQRLKRSAFTAWVGKELASQWEKDSKRRTILRESLPTLVGGRAVDGGAGGGKLGEMLDNLTLLRGTETVWDAIGQQVMSLGAVRADYTSELTSKWQEHTLRKTIEARNLVFDPTQQADPVTHVNIFGGWPLVPKARHDLVAPILALLASLCEAEDKAAECVEWILKWLAYPLQHPGAKMQTALLVFGEKQGTGKSLFFQDVLLPIYGEYGGVASQHQLDSTFTAWRSRKLFMLFEEVLSRDDRYSHNGTLKYMITGKSMSINQKNLPERDERNHMNSAFLSNEPQPIPIELEDRRFMVIEARRKQEKAFYDDVQAAIAAGGCEAFYHFLLNLPLEDFNEHTKPPMTLAKERVIEFGLNSWMSFHRAWKDGYLDAPYCSCLSEDLYIIYKRWCDKSGEKSLTLCKFAGLIASREHKAKKSVAVDSKHKKTRMVFVVDNPDYPEDLDTQIAKFRKLGDVRADRALQG